MACYLQISEATAPTAAPTATTETAPVAGADKPGRCSCTRPHCRLKAMPSQVATLGGAGSSRWFRALLGGVAGLTQTCPAASTGACAYVCRVMANRQRQEAKPRIRTSSSDPSLFGSRFRECRTMNPDINDGHYYPTGCGSMCDNTFLRRKVLEEGCRNGKEVQNSAYECRM